MSSERSWSMVSSRDEGNKEGTHVASHDGHSGTRARSVLSTKEHSLGGDRLGVRGEGVGERLVFVCLVFG